MATGSKSKKPTKDSSTERVRVSCSLTPDTVRLLDVLSETGLWGRSRAEVMERLATDRIMRMWQDGDLDPNKLKSLLLDRNAILAMKSSDH